MHFSPASSGSESRALTRGEGIPQHISPKGASTYDVRIGEGGHGKAEGRLLKFYSINQLQMWTRGGVKKFKNYADIIYGSSQSRPAAFIMAFSSNGGKETVVILAVVERKRCRLERIHAPAGPRAFYPIQSAAESSREANIPTPFVHAVKREGQCIMILYPEEIMNCGHRVQGKLSPQI